MIGRKRKGEFMGRKAEQSNVKRAKSGKKNSLEGSKNSGAVQKRLETSQVAHNKSEEKSTAKKQSPSNKDAFSRKKKPWFMCKQNLENGETEQKSSATITAGKNLPVIKTVATYSTSNFSSNWKALAQALHLNEGKKKHGPPVACTPIDKRNASTRVKKRNSLKKVKVKVNKERRPTLNVANEPQASGPLDIWFDDVDEELLKINEAPCTTPTVAASSAPASSNDSSLAKPGNFSGATKTVAMDCEMVGVGDGGKDSILARVSVVNRMGHTVYDKFVKPREKVTDYRTHVSGVRPSDLENAEDFATVQKEVYEIINGRILVGHAVYNDLQVLFLSHPKSKIRDTSKYKPFRKLFDGRTPSLKKLTEKLVGVAVQTGEHNSVQDAQAAMRLYTMHRKVWEKELKTKKIGKKKEESVVK